MITKPRIIIGIALVVLMLMAGVYVVLNWEKVFTNKVDIRYPDDCVETYINTKLITEECTEGRMLAEKELEDKKKQHEDKWAFNISKT